MSLRLAVVLAALVVCAQADYLNFGTYAEDFEPAPGFVLTTVNDRGLLRDGRPGLLQSSTVIVVKVGAGVRNLIEGQTVYPSLQRNIDSTGAITDAPLDAVDTRAYCPQPFDINGATLRSPATAGVTAPFGAIPNPISQVEDPLVDPSDPLASAFRGNYCIYHESQIAAVINNQAVRGSVGSSQIFNSYGFVSNVAGTTRPTL
jgi:hypothetical protein